MVTTTTTTYTQLPPPNITSTCKYPHTVQFTGVQWSIVLVVGKMHHQCKLQQMMTTTFASGVFAPVDGRKNTTSAKVRTSIGASHSRMQQQHTTTATNISDQIRTNTGTNVIDSAINATCIREWIHECPKFWRTFIKLITSTHKPFLIQFTVRVIVVNSIVIQSGNSSTDHTISLPYQHSTSVNTCKLSVLYCIMHLLPTLSTTQSAVAPYCSKPTNSRSCYMKKHRYGI